MKVDSSAIVSRINKLLEERELTINKAAILMGIPQTTINPQIKGQNPVSLQTVMCILSTFTNISAEWLLTGEGPMHKTDPGTIVNNAHTRNGNANAGGTQIVNDQSALLAEKDKRLEEKDQRIAELQSDKDFLRSMLTKLAK